MKARNKAARWAAFLLLLPILLQTVLPALAQAGPGAEEEKETVYLRTAGDLLELARSCTLDTWSRNRTVVLLEDISLEGEDFLPIPTFGGTFDGGGHTISGLSIGSSVSPAGLFGVVQEGAVVRDLTVTGTAAPSGDGGTVGGIAGINYGKLTDCAVQGYVDGSSMVGGVVGLNETSGQLINCSFRGAVTGEHYVGGIAGWNAGSLIQCENSGSINTTVVDVEVQLSGLDLLRLNSTENVPAGTDIGGIAGFSSGLLQSCRNTGDVGYEHMGYNVGGIVGRQSGYLDGCVNSGTVRGRKDVGGIAGQMEPQVTLKYSENVLSSLWDELDVLECLMDRTLNDAEDAAHAISGSVSDLTDSVGAAKDSASGLSDAMVGWANTNIEQINDASARLSWVITRLEPVMENVTSALELMEEASVYLDAALDDAEAAGDLGTAAVSQMRLAIEDLQVASAYARSTGGYVESALKHLKNSLGDEEENKTALKELSGAVSDLGDAFSEISKCLVNIGQAMEQAYDWVKNDPAWIQLREGVSELRAAMTEISAALEEVSAALDRIVELGASEENLALLNSAAAHLSAAVTHLSNAYDDFSAALDAYTEGELSQAEELLVAGFEDLGQADREITAAQQDIDQVISNLVENAGEFEQAAEDLRAGLSHLYDGLAAANAAMEKINDAVDQLEESEVPEETRAVLEEELPRLRQALADAEAAASRIGAALETLEENFDETEAEMARSELRKAADELDRCAQALDRSVAHMSSALELMEQAGAYGSAAMEDLDRAGECLGKAVTCLRQAADRVTGITAELAEKPAIQFQPIDSSLTEQGDALDSAISQVIDRVDALNSAMTAASETLLEDLRAINRQVGVIIDLLRKGSEEAQNAEASDHFEDISDQELYDDRTSGRISSARNTGTVEGDINVAGIVGSLAIEYDFDPEDDLTETGSRSLDSQYQTVAVVLDCVNEGPVIAKKNCAGGIVGRMDLGTVCAGENYGSVESTGGDYVGGIAGYSCAAIRSCFAKCTLSGDSYVGGILGAGSEDSVVQGCYSMVQITDSRQYSGAVSGTDTGAFTGNCFVSDELAGLGRVSYSGKAEPISYWDLLAVEGLPRPFQHLTLRFTAEDETLLTLNFDYDDSLDESVYPNIPRKEGYYARWERTELEHLRFDTVVSVIYTQYISALEDARRREDGRPVFFVEGQFQEGDQADITAQALTPAAFGVIPGDGREALESYFSFIENRTWPKMTVSREVVEQWSIDIPDDGQPTHRIRYLPPDGRTDHLVVYVKEDGGWVKAEHETAGSYLVFTVTGNQAEIAVVSTLSVWWMWLLALILVLLVILVIVKLIRKLRRWKGGRRQAAAVAAGAPALPGQTPPGEEQEKEHT
ncbi:MAG: GLUG motif-containing protein [Candidatus Enterenecus sp.]